MKWRKKRRSTNLLQAMRQGQFNDAWCDQINCWMKELQNEINSYIKKISAKGLDRLEEAEKDEVDHEMLERIHQFVRRPHKEIHSLKVVMRESNIDINLISSKLEKFEKIAVDRLWDLALKTVAGILDPRMYYRVWIGPIRG